MTLALNKSSLKQQRDQLDLYRKFLPSLDLKRQQLMAALKEAQGRLAEADAELRDIDRSVEELAPLLGGPALASRDLSQLVHVAEVRVETENLAGVRVPRVVEVRFEKAPYSTLATPFWLDQFVAILQRAAEARIRHAALARRVELLQAASRRVTQRVNLFEKVLIPQALADIKRIQIFLADQERSAVVRSKIAKAKP
ncbi:MAG: V-type ATP synthase subunit D [Pirellulales bacterium]|nr:V-type ATP synthase subunit D [Pirellulales bacterium]